MRRYIEVALFVVGWIVAGYAFRLDANAYLVLGVPLVALFQVLVCRQPLQELWVRDAQSLRLDLPAFALAAGLMLIPGYEFFSMALPSRDGAIILWMVCCLAGAVFAAFALRHQRASSARRALVPFSGALVIGIGIMAAAAVASGRSPVPGRLVFFFGQFFLYFPVCFTLEEVVFRGALDSHLFNPASEPRARPACFSALFVSAFWGAWHLPPALSASNLSLNASIQILLGLILVHTILGVCLSFCWRHAGTLVLPAAAHALIDAYRNAVLI